MNNWLVIAMVAKLDVELGLLGAARVLMARMDQKRKRIHGYCWDQHHHPCDLHDTGAVASLPVVEDHLDPGIQEVGHQADEAPFRHVIEHHLDPGVQEVGHQDVEGPPHHVADHHHGRGNIHHHGFLVGTVANYLSPNSVPQPLGEGWESSHLEAEEHLAHYPH